MGYPETEFGRDIISSLSMCAKVKARYPLRMVWPDAMCPNGQFCYFNPSGSVRVVHEDGEIFECDLERGYPWMRKIWPRTK